MADMGAKSVLVVEDEDALRSLLVKHLTEGGFNALQAPDGDQGLELALRRRPDLILLDLTMPHDGLTMLKQLRTDEAYGAHARVVILTNSTPDDEHIIHAIEQYEPAFFLVKADQTPAVVVEKVREALA